MHEADVCHRAKLRPQQGGVRTWLGLSSFWYTHLPLLFFYCLLNYDCRQRLLGWELHGVQQTETTIPHRLFKLESELNRGRFISLWRYHEPHQPHWQTHYQPFSQELTRTYPKFISHTNISVDIFRHISPILRTERLQMQRYLTISKSNSEFM